MLYTLTEFLKYNKPTEQNVLLKNTFCFMGFSSKSLEVHGVIRKVADWPNKTETNGLVLKGKIIDRILTEQARSKIAHVLSIFYTCQPISHCALKVQKVVQFNDFFPRLEYSVEPTSLAYN